MYWTKKHVVVCTASHCNQKGAMDVVGKLRIGVLRQGLDDEILVNNCGTIDLCDVGPNLVVYPDNVILNGVTIKDVPEVIAYLNGGPTPERLVLDANTPAEANRHDFYAKAVSLNVLPTAEFWRWRRRTGSMKPGSPSSSAADSRRRSLIPKAALTPSRSPRRRARGIQFECDERMNRTMPRLPSISQVGVGMGVAALNVEQSRRV